MTIAEEQIEKARDYVRGRQGTIDTWVSKGAQQTTYGVSYWVWKGKECLGKVMNTGTDLVTVVDFLKGKEQLAIDSGVIPKMAPPAPPTPPITDLYGCCVGCGTTAQRSSACPACGMWVN